MCRRFVILRHEMPDGPRGSHFDLMLEADGVLLTWAVTELPRPGIEVVAEELPDHRIAYLTYEGPVSRNRGSVDRWDEGYYHLVERDEVSLVARLQGAKMTGVLHLDRSDKPSPIWIATLRTDSNL